MGESCIILIALGVVVLAFSACQLHGQSLVVDNGRISELSLGGRQRAPQSHDEPFWLLELQEIDTGEFIKIASITSGRFAIHSTPLEIERTDVVHRMRWTVTGASDANLVAIVDTWVVADGERLDFHFAVERLDSKYNLWRVWYPQIPLTPLGDSPDDDTLVVPWTHGQVIENIHSATPGRHPNWPSLEAIARIEFPSYTGALQMTYYSDPSGGILFMTPDGARRIKELVIDRPGQHLRATFIHYLTPLEPLAERVEMAYPVTAHWVAGDWYDAAQIYRNWALNEPWAIEVGPLATRERTPDWFRGLPSWVATSRNPLVDWEEKIGWPLDWIEAVGGPMALHWYPWDEEGGPKEYVFPLQRDPHPDVPELLTKYHEAGLYVMPYLNARIISMNGPLWDDLKASVVRDPQGEVTDGESWLSKFWDDEEYNKAIAEGRRVRKVNTHKGLLYEVYHDFAVGCMDAPRWTQILFDRNMELTLKYGFDGVYADQLGCLNMLCYDRRHGHKPGDPLAWINAQEAAYARNYAEFKRHGEKKLIFSEYVAEDVISVADGGLTVNAYRLSAHMPVPLFPAVYHTHFASIGWAKDEPALLERAPTKYLQQRMMALIYGAQIGWLEHLVPELLANHPDIVACFKSAVSLRRDYPSMLGYGKMLRPPVVEGVETLKSPLLDERRGIRPQPTPAIMGGLFRDEPDGDRALAVFCNWTDVRRTGVARIDISELAGPVRASFVSGEPIGGVWEGSELKVELDMAPASVTGVVIESSPSGGS